MVKANDTIWFKQHVFCILITLAYFQQILDIRSDILYLNLIGITFLVLKCNADAVVAWWLCDYVYDLVITQLTNEGLYGTIRHQEDYLKRTIGVGGFLDMSCSAVQSWRTATCRNLKSSVQSSRGLFDPIFLWIYFSKLEPGAQWYCLSCLAHSYQQRALVMDSITVLLLFPQYLPAATARHSPTCIFMSLFHRHENKQNDPHNLTLRSQQWFGWWGASGVEGGLS